MAKPRKKTTPTTKPSRTGGPSGRARPAPKSRITAGGASKVNSELQQKFKILQKEMEAVREILNMEEDPSLLVEELRALLNIDIPTPVSNIDADAPVNPHSYNQPPEQQLETAHFNQPAEVQEEVIEQ